SSRRRHTRSAGIGRLTSRTSTTSALMSPGVIIAGKSLARNGIHGREDCGLLCRPRRIEADGITLDETHHRVVSWIQAFPEQALVQVLFREKSIQAADRRVKECTGER